MQYREGDTVIFTNESGKTVRFREEKYKPGADLTVKLTRDWDTDEDLGGGGPWGWGGFTSKTVKNISA